jgi:tetratricopeptide (TPR) repeat protein
LTFPSNISDYQNDNQQISYGSPSTNDLGEPQWLPPSELGQFDDGSGEARGVYVSGTVAYVADGGDGLEIIDVSDPANPTELGQFDDGGSAQGVYISGTIAYVADGEDGLEIIDVSDPANPTELGQFDDGGSAHGVYVSGTVAYVADRGDGLEIIDVSDPANPTELGQFDDGGSAYGVYVSGTVAYVADGGDGLEIIDVSDPANPTELGQFDYGGSAHDVYVSGTVAYLADGWNSLEIINVSDPANPTKLGQFYYCQEAWGVYASGTIAYIADWYRGLEIIDTGYDSDGDNLTDATEIYSTITDPNDPDSDDDGMPDGWEVSNSLNPLLDDSISDPDSDNLINLDEFTHNTDPNDSDTDGDGMNDGEEIAFGYDPNNSSSNLFITVLTIIISIVIISVISLVIVGRKINKKRKESFNDTLISEIEAKIKEGEEFKVKGELEKILNIYNEQLLSSEKLYDSVNKEKIITKIKNLIDDTLVLTIEENIRQGEKLVNTGRFDNAIKNFQKQFIISERLYDSVNKEKTITKIKNLIDETNILKIEENIRQGEQLNKEGDFVNAIKIFNKQLENTKLIFEISTREKITKKIREYLLYSKIAKTKRIIIDLGSRYSRLEVIDIVEKCGEEEGLIISTIQDMIKNREISAEYFKGSKAVAFSQQVDVDEIDKLMKSFDEWEKEGRGKKK